MTWSSSSLKYIERKVISSVETVAAWDSGEIIVRRRNATTQILDKGISNSPNSVVLSAPEEAVCICDYYFRITVIHQGEKLLKKQMDSLEFLGGAPVRLKWEGDTPSPPC